jgi:hypothetical protein
MQLLDSNSVSNQNTILQMKDNGIYSAWNYGSKTVGGKSKKKRPSKTIGRKSKKTTPRKTRKYNIRL